MRLPGRRIAPDLTLVKGVVSGQAIITVFCVGAALLGFWLTVRFPERGPQRLASSFLSIVLAMAALSLTAPLVGSSPRALDAMARHLAFSSSSFPP